VKDREHVLYRTAILVLVAICLYLGWQWHALAVVTTTKSQSETALLESQQHRVAEVTALQSDQQRLNAEVTRLQADLDRAKESPFVVCSPLKAKGPSDPVAALIADLRTHTDLIPFQPIGGGQTHIDAWLINCDWVLAAVGDGHKGIWAMLHYEITNGQIKWTVLATGT
jgi:hypothetical protein